MEIAYKRVLLKLSGEALAGKAQNGIDAETLGKICDKIKKIVNMGVEVSIVVGGGNFWRGRYGHQMERTTSATSYMSPLFILSILSLYLLFQFNAISVEFVSKT